MLEKLFLENFQGFGRFTTVRLAPLTLIFGPNSSGKSSIIRALRLMQQGVRTSKRQPGAFRFDSEDVDLGSFANTVTGHLENKKIKIGVEFDNFDLEKANGRKFWLDKIVFTINSAGELPEILVSGGSLTETIDDDYFDLKFTATNDVEARKRKRFIDWPLLTLDPRSNEILEKLVNLSDQGTKPGRVSPLGVELEAFLASFLKNDELTTEIDVQQFLAAAKDARVMWAAEEFIPDVDVPPIPKEFLQKSPSAGARVRISWERAVVDKFTNIRDALVDMRKLYATQFSDELMFHVGPLRPIPERLTIVNSGAAENFREPNEIPSFLASNAKALSQVSTWIGRLTKGAYELDFLKFETGDVRLVGNVGALVLRDTRSGTHVTFKDVGVGLSQVLPILSTVINAETSTVRSPSKSRNSTILLEQPELHLHPTMQGKLMTLLVEHVAGKDGRQIIAETHSENMVLRLQNEIRRGRISAESVSVLYVHRDEVTGESKIEQLGLNDNGDFLTEWPESFSDSRFKQIDDDTN